MVVGIFVVAGFFVLRGDRFAAVTIEEPFLGSGV